MYVSIELSAFSLLFMRRLFNYGRSIYLHNKKTDKRVLLIFRR